MQVFALFGCQTYEGDDLLGVYSTIELARAARDSYQAMQLEDEDYFYEYDEFRIRALGVDATAMSVPFFTSL
jgi:hypothetical protein